jgi:hypothetical protein
MVLAAFSVVRFTFKKMINQRKTEYNVLFVLSGVMKRVQP